MHNTADSSVQARILKTIQRRSFCTLATSSSTQHAHSAGVVYAFAEQALWVHMIDTSRKARNIAENGQVGICIPFRRMPVGPPYTIHFQATAELVSMDDPRAQEQIKAGSLKAIIGHGALEMSGGVFARITPKRTIHSFGPGARMIDLVRDPLNSGARSFTVAS